jgi:hypothetical protein
VEKNGKIHRFKAKKRVFGPFFSVFQQILLLRFFHHHFAFVVKLSFVPVGTVPQVRLAGSLVDTYSRYACFIGSPAAVCARSGHFSFGIWHDFLI